MKIQQQKFPKATGWETLKDDHFDPASCNFAMAFGSSSIPGDPALYQTVRDIYPGADIILNYTAGKIYDTPVNDDTLSLTAVYFEAAKIKTAAVQVNEVKNSFGAGRLLAAALDPVNLKNVLVISGGQKVNGSELVLGIQAYFSAILPSPAFYSYGEISPSFKSIKCDLYNQPMTILTLSE